MGSSGGLIVVNLSTYQPTLRAFPIVGGLSTDVITGTVLGVSPDSRYVVVSDVANSLVFFIDTTGTKVAQRFNIPNITSVTFAPDDSNFWIGGASGVYEYQADTFVPISDINSADAGLSTNVNSLAWTPDGQSFFASGGQLINYSTCNDKETQPIARSGQSDLHGDQRPVDHRPALCRYRAGRRASPARARRHPTVVRLFGYQQLGGAQSDGSDQLTGRSRPERWATSVPLR